MLLEFFLTLSDWRTRWEPRVSESPEEEWEILFSYFIYSTDAGSPTRVFVFFSLSGHQAMVVSGNRDYTGMWVRRGSTNLMAGKVVFLRGQWSLIKVVDLIVMNP
ncbi:hypothetical protein TNCV_3796951 [Trichonephila clavipes]|nr:hypothetical protein TNCV_3796951 [Trichonephila clavipes]